MQGNAPVQAARAARKWVEDTGVDVLEQLAYSPDLKPIEYLWYRL